MYTPVHITPPVIGKIPVHITPPVIGKIPVHITPPVIGKIVLNNVINVTYRPREGEMEQTNYTTGTLNHPLDKETIVDYPTQLSSLWAWPLSSGFVLFQKLLYALYHRLGLLSLSFLDVPSRQTCGGRETESTSNARYRVELSVLCSCIVPLMRPVT